MSAHLSEPEGHTPELARCGDDPRVELAHRIERLRAAGAARWDAPAFTLLTSLQRRSERDLGGRGRALAWALERCAALERWMEGARGAIDAIVASSADDRDGRDAKRAALEQGDLPTAQVLAALAAVRPRAAPPSRPRAVGQEERFEASLLEARTAVVSAQAHAASSEPSGPYNPTALAGKLLACIDDLSPAYLRACVEAFHDLAALQAGGTGGDAAPKRPRRSRPPGRTTGAPPRKTRE